ncbi:putative sugar kinase [Halomicronema hongdechloris C2206]|uniref:D-ribulose kinase n=1 Tax=Halomicronema hongdechloris C2206 TaxID=1641165 RepID=A0A1Z3HRL5_9CYAN|nr:FGGY-family carbohydrate kinase [Halomicronema hongdechloris]ASC72777.1 putative sugar kinase [Halomicronema hongdechloris C2206]
MALALGIDVGTSGLRAVVVATDRRLRVQCCHEYSQGEAAAPPDWPRLWQTGLRAVLVAVPRELRPQIGAIAVAGTSGTVMLCDGAGMPLTAPLFYNDGRAQAEAKALTALAPAGSPVLSATSSLAKLLWWRQHLPAEIWQQGQYFLHQADWIGAQLHGHLGISDYHNALKLGYDVGALRYPAWMVSLGLDALLPQVIAPGDAISLITPTMARQFGLPRDCQVCAGTTDSIAAFLASGAYTPGEAVTSLGSTLVLKLLSQQRVDDSPFGIYSHRLGDQWLVGGASNAGGAALRHFFSDEQLHHLSQRIRPDIPSSLDYYPLMQPGERFPINDPALSPRLTPRPERDVDFLHGLLESLARIEALGYERLQTLGASPLQRVYTAGGGARNQAWTAIRQRIMGCPVSAAAQTEAAYGAALLALKTLQ